MSKESSSGQEYTPLPASTDTSGNHRGIVLYVILEAMQFGERERPNRAEVR